MDISTLLRLNDAKVHTIEVEPNPERKVAPPVGGKEGSRLVLHRFTAPFSATIEAAFEVVLTGTSGVQYWAGLMDGAQCIEYRRIARVRGIHAFTYQGNRYLVRALAHREHDPV